MIERLIYCPFSLSNETVDELKLNLCLHNKDISHCNSIGSLLCFVLFCFAAKPPNEIRQTQQKERSKSVVSQYI